MSDKAYQSLNLRDRVTGASQIIDTDHSSVHEGLGYALAVNSDSLAQNAFLAIVFVPHWQDVYVHLKDWAAWINKSPALFQLLESPIFSGATITYPINRNRVKPRMGLGTYYVNPSTLSGGTALEEWYLGGGDSVGQTSLAGSGKTDQEIVMRPGNTYAIKLTNLNASAAYASLRAFWYEEEAG